MHVQEIERAIYRECLNDDSCSRQHVVDALVRAAPDTTEKQVCGDLGFRV